MRLKINGINQHAVLKIMRHYRRFTTNTTQCLGYSSKGLEYALKGAYLGAAFFREIIVFMSSLYLYCCFSDLDSPYILYIKWKLMLTSYILISIIPGTLYIVT
jgi:hypothetical protein